MKHISLIPAQITKVAILPSVNGYFSTVLSRLEQKQHHAEQVEKYRTELVTHLKSFVVVSKVFSGGSYKKRTLITPLQGDRFSVDLFAVISNKLYYAYHTRPNAQAQILQYVSQNLARFPAYEHSVIKRTGQAVTLVLPEFNVDVIPAFTLNKGGYYMPDIRNGGRWLTTYPEQQDDELNNLDMDFAHAARPLLLLVRGWNAAHNIALTGFMVEVLVSNYLRSIPAGKYAYPSLLGDFFVKLGTAKVSARYRRGDDVLSPLNSGETLHLKKLLAAAGSDSTRARVAEDQGLTGQAIEYWRKVFGAYSP